MIRRMLSFLLVMVGFIGLFFVAFTVSHFVSSEEEIKGVLTILRLIFEGAFIGAPFYFLKKLKGDEAFDVNDKKKCTFMAAFLIILIVAVEVVIFFQNKGV